MQHTTRSFAALHFAIVGGCGMALEELIQRVLPILRSRLRATFRRADEGAMQDAVEDSLAEYALMPTHFHPAEGMPLDRFLYQAAWRNMADSLKAAGRRRARENTFAISMEIERRAAPASQPEETEFLEALGVLTATVFSASECKALGCWLGGERRTEPIAVALGLSHLALSDQRREVKRFKDRSLKRLHRILGIGVEV